MEVTVTVISWELVDSFIKTLVAKIKQQTSGKAVWGIPRGGTIVAGLLNYKGFEFATAPVPVVKCSTIIVDDICCTGETLQTYTWQGCLTGTLVYRRSSKYQPTCWGWEIANNDYVIFPWEDEALIRKKVLATENIDFCYKGVERINGCRSKRSF